VVRSQQKQVFFYYPSTVMTRPASDEVQALRKELDDVRSQVRQLTDKLLPAYQGAGVSVEDAAEPLREHLGISRGLVVRRVREGSPAEKAGLKPNDVIPDVLEPQLVEAIESGKPIDLIRQGAKQRLKGR
jgi:S1-C subfamily serine protease